METEMKGKSEMVFIIAPFLFDSDYSLTGSRTYCTMISSFSLLHVDRTLVQLLN